MEGNPMQQRSRRVVATATALALVAASGAALAANSHSSLKSGGRGAIRNAVAGYLGLTKQQLGVDLRSGETLAQIATAQGASVGGLEPAILAAVNSRLDQAVAAGKLTSQREQLILSRLSARLDKLVNSTHPRALIRFALLRRRLLRLSARSLGLTPQALRLQLQAGKTLAQIVTDQGKTVTGFEQTIMTAVTARLDQAVAAGRITSQREQRILARLPARLDSLVNHTFAQP